MSFKIPVIICKIYQYILCFKILKSGVKKGSLERTENILTWDYTHLLLAKEKKKECQTLF